MLVPSKKQYIRLHETWQRSGILSPLLLSRRLINSRLVQANGYPECPPTKDLLEEYWWWYAGQSRGKIGERSTLKTILYMVGRFPRMYSEFYDHEVSPGLTEELERVSSYYPLPMTY